MPIIESRCLRISLLLSLLFTAASPSVADIFQRTNPDGSVEFTDVPSDDNEQPLDIEDTSPGLIIPSDRRMRNQAPKLTTQPEETKVKVRVTITHPTHDTALRDNSGSMTVTVKVEPRLAQNHFLTLSSSAGAKAAPQKGFEFNLTDLDRGTHNFTAKIVDQKGKTIASSPPVTVHLLRNSILFPNQRNMLRQR